VNASSPKSSSNSDSTFSKEVFMTTQLPNPAEMYEQFYGPGIFQPMTELFVRYAAPKLGEHVLDMACGTGLVARHVAPLVGNSGKVVAIDINPAMLEVARRKPVPEGAPIEWREGDAVTIELPDGTFDLVLCQQGLQFFSDKVVALQRLRKALRPGGRIALALWQGIEAQSLVAEFAKIEALHLAPLGVRYDDLLAPFTLGDAKEIQALLESARFSRVSIVPQLIETRFPSPETFARNMEIAYGAVVPAFIQNPSAFAEFVNAVERETKDVVRRYVQGNSVSFPMTTNFILAHAN
jgi:ubiquinone/menaquinone biosynthesis C-methylase UbiE